MGDNEVHTEVPGSLKRLARYIVRGFYTPEHVIIIDMLVRNPCIKEDDLIELLKLERKQLRASLNTLKIDRFIKSRMKVETTEDGKNSKHNYYFINYKVFVNVVKYKLDHMRRKIELEERDNTSRASFKCPSCDKTFTDLEADQLFDPMTGSLCCTFCSTEVEEDESAMPKKDARMMLAKFNEQIRPLYDLLAECDGITLAPWVLEPEPTDMKPLLNRAKGGSSKSQTDGSTWSGDSSRNRGFGTTENTVTVTVKQDGDISPAKDTNAPKAVPDWIAKSTVSGVPMEQERPVESSLEVNTSSSWTDSSKLDTRDDIMRTLLVHERKAAAVRIPGAGSDDESSTSESDQEKSNQPSTSNNTVAEMESDGDEDSTPVVIVGGHKIPLGDITDDIIAKMTPTEKDEYIRLSQEMYEDMFL